MAVDGSIKGVLGRVCACGWAVVQLEMDMQSHDMVNRVPCQSPARNRRTIERVKVYASMVTLKVMEGPSIQSGSSQCSAGTSICAGPKHKDAGLWKQVWEDDEQDAHRTTRILTSKHVEAHSNRKSGGNI